MQTDLPYEMNQVRRQSKRQIALGLLIFPLLRQLNLEIVVFDLLKGLVAEHLRVINSLVEFGLCEIETSCGFTEVQSRQSQALRLVECVGKERVDGVVLSKLLLEDEQVVVVVEDTIEVRL